MKRLDSEQNHNQSKSKHFLFNYIKIYQSSIDSYPSILKVYIWFLQKINIF